MCLLPALPAIAALLPAINATRQFHYGNTNLDIRERLNFARRVFERTFDHLHEAFR